MLKSFNKLEIVRGYVSVSFHMRSIFYMLYRFWWESPKERDHWEDQGVGGKMGSEGIVGRLA
jgi:hypothetical protein